MRGGRLKDRLQNGAALSNTRPAQDILWTSFGLTVCIEGWTAKRRSIAHVEKLQRAVRSEKATTGRSARAGVLQAQRPLGEHPVQACLEF